MEIQPPVALYKQVANHLRERILAGEFPSGAPLPGEHALSEQFGLSRVTINKAITELRAEGLVEVVRGRGVFVRGHARLTPATVWPRQVYRDPGGQYADPTGRAWLPVEQPTLYRENATAELAELLAVEEGHPLFCQDTLLAEQDGTARQYYRARVPFAVLAGTPLEETQTVTSEKLYTILEQAGRSLRWTERVQSRMPIPDEARTLRMPQGTPLLHLSRLTATHDSKPLALEEFRLSAADLALTYDIASTGSTAGTDHARAAAGPPRHSGTD